MKNDDPFNKWACYWNRVLSKEEVKMVNKCFKDSSASLKIRKMKIKATLRFHLEAIRMAMVNKKN